MPVSDFKNKPFDYCRFEEKSEVMEQLDHQLRRLHSSTEALFEYRRALANSTGSLSRWEK